MASRPAPCPGPKPEEQPAKPVPLRGMAALPDQCRETLAAVMTVVSDRGIVATPRTPPMVYDDITCTPATGTAALLKLPVEAFNKMLITLPDAVYDTLWQHQLAARKNKKKTPPQSAKKKKKKARRNMQAAATASDRGHECPSQWSQTMQYKKQDMKLHYDCKLQRMCGRRNGKLVIIIKRSEHAAMCKRSSLMMPCTPTGAAAQQVGAAADSDVASSSAVRIMCEENQLLHTGKHTSRDVTMKIPGGLVTLHRT